MLSVVERIDILDEADKYAANRQFQELDQFIASLAADDVLQEPLLTYYDILTAVQLGRLVEADAIVMRSEPFIRRHQDARVYRRFLNVSGIVLTHTGNLSDAAQRFEEAYALASASSDKQIMADATMNLGVLADIQGHWSEALAAQCRALAVFAELGDLEMVAGCHHNIGITYRQLKRYDEARNQFDRAMDLYSHSGGRAEIAATALEKAILHAISGELALGEAIARGAYYEIRSLSHARLMGEAQRTLGMIYGRMNRKGRSERYLQLARANAASSGNLLLKGETAEELGRLYREIGEPTREQAAWTEAYEAYVQAGALWRADNIHRLSRAPTDS